MELKKFIEIGTLKAGSQKALGELIDVSSLQLTHAKGNRAGLPAAACGLLAELINEDETVILAASELITEKNPKRRAYWEKKLEAIAASIFLFVILNMTPSPAEATPAWNLAAGECILCQIV